MNGKNEEFKCLFIIPRLIRAELVGSCMDTVFDMKSKLLSESRLALEGLVSEGVITNQDVKERLLSMGDYAFKSQGTNDYIMNEALPLYPFYIILYCFFVFYIVICLNCYFYPASGLYSSLYKGLCYSKILSC